jgi:hypothetical protein
MGGFEAILCGSSVAGVGFRTELRVRFEVRYFLNFTEPVRTCPDMFEPRMISVKMLEKNGNLKCIFKLHS